MEITPEYMGEAVRHQSHVLNDGFAQINHSLLRSKHLPSEEKLLFCVLSSHADKDRFSFPSVDTLCEETGYSKPIVQRAKKCLIEKGLISSEPRYNKYGRTSDGYIINNDAALEYAKSNQDINHQKVRPTKKRSGTDPKDIGGEVEPIEEEPLSTYVRTQQLTSSPQASKESDLFIGNLWHDTFGRYPTSPQLRKTRAHLETAPLDRADSLLEHAFDVMAGYKDATPSSLWGLLKKWASQDWNTERPQRGMVENMTVLN